MKKLLAFSLCFLLLFGTSVSAEKTVSTEYYTDDIAANFESDDAVAVSSTPEVSAPCAILMEKETGKVLYEKNPHEKKAPASITKVMSLLLFMEAIDRKELSLNDKVTASTHASSMGGSQIWLKENEVMTVDELLKAVVIASANDATVALAEAVAGSEEAFVGMMNDRAKELRMNNTHFENCSGLDAEGHITTAYDIAIMSCELIKHVLIKDYSTVWMDSLRNGESELVNTNKLVRFYEGATGLKTGTTSEAGFCVSATAEKNGMELCAVILGAENNDGRFSSAKALLNYGFANYEIAQISVDKKELSPIKVKMGVNETLPIKASGKAVFLLKKGEKEKLTTEIRLPESVEAPVAENQKIGSAHILLDGKKQGEIDIVASVSCEKLNFYYALKRLLSALFTP